MEVLGTKELINLKYNPTDIKPPLATAEMLWLYAVSHDYVAGKFNEKFSSNGCYVARLECSHYDVNFVWAVIRESVLENHYFLPIARVMTNNLAVGRLGGEDYVINIFIPNNERDTLNEDFALDVMDFLEKAGISDFFIETSAYSVVNDVFISTH